MRCRNIQTQLTCYVQGGLSAAEAAALENHVQACPSCRERLAQLQKVWACLGELSAPDASPSVLPGVLTRIDAHEQKQARTVGAWLAPLKPSFAGAAACVMLLGFVAGLFIAALRPLNGQGHESTGDLEYADIVADATAPAFSEAYLQLSGSADEEDPL